MASLISIVAILLAGALIVALGELFSEERRAIRRAKGELRLESARARAFVNEVCSTAEVPSEVRRMVFDEYHSVIACPDEEARLAGFRAVSQMASLHLGARNSSHSTSFSR